jgi:hypothetical protein
MNTKDLLNTLTDALQTGKLSLQSGLRDFIEEGKSDNQGNEYIAQTVADVVAEYKWKAMDRLAASYIGTEEGHKYVKATDNIINDVARICRHELGYTIVCTKRGNIAKGRGWVYTAQIPKPPKLRAASSPMTTYTPPCLLTHFDHACHIHKPQSEADAWVILKGYGVDLGTVYHARPGMLCPEPELVEWLVKMGHSPIALGKAMAAFITAHKES